MIILAYTHTFLYIAISFPVNKFIDHPSFVHLVQVDLLNADERSKVLQKREKNKVAAEKCRIKRREKVEQTRSEYYDCQELNESLETQVKQLKEERQMLEELLKSHRCVKQHA